VNLPRDCAARRDRGRHVLVFEALVTLLSAPPAVERPPMPEADASSRLRRLGDGVSIDDVCAADGIERAAFDAWWAAECAGRLPALDGNAAMPVSRPVQILRDGRG